MGESRIERTTAAVGAVVAASVGLLASIGISGDLLGRLVRNHPAPTRLVVLLLFAAVALALSKRTNFQRLGIAVVLVVAVTLVWLGVGASGDREKAAIALSQNSPTTATVKVSSGGLRSNEDVVIQVLALDEFPLAATEKSDLPPSICTTDQSRADSGKGAGFTVILWAQAGPDVKGTATFESSIVLPSNSAALCAAAFTREADGAGNSAAVLRVTVR